MFSRCVDDPMTQCTPASRRPLQPHRHSRQRDNPALRHHLAINRLFAQRNVLNFARLARPLQQLRNDYIVLHPKAGLEMALEKWTPQFRRKSLPTPFMMLR